MSLIDRVRDFLDSDRVVREVNVYRFGDYVVTFDHDGAARWSQRDAANWLNDTYRSMRRLPPAIRQSVNRQYLEEGTFSGQLYRDVAGERHCADVTLSQRRRRH